MRFRLPARLDNVPGLAAPVGILLVALAFVSSQAGQTARVAADARLVQTGESVLGSAVAARANLGLVLALSASRDSEERQAAVDQARRSLDVLAARTALFDDLTHEPLVVAAAESARSLGAEVIELALDGRSATEADVTMFTANVDLIVNRVRETVAGAQAEIDAELSIAGRLSGIAGFSVALLGPALAVWTVRSSWRRRSRQALLEAELKREHELVKTKTEMLGNLSHELRTPLTGIYGFAATMAESLGGPQVAGERQLLRETTNLIVSEAADLTRMLEDLLTAARANEEGIAYQIQPVEVVREIDAVVEPYRRTDVAVSISCPHNVVAEADRLRLRQVLRNLVSNAVRHGWPPIEIVGEVTGDGVIVEVADHGPGVSPDLEARLFERYIHRGSTPLTTGSIGLGLSIASTLCAGMRGSLAYRRQDGTSIFTITLPRAITPPDRDVPVPWNETPSPPLKPAAAPTAPPVITGRLPSGLPG